MKERRINYLINKIYGNNFNRDALETLENTGIFYMVPLNLDLAFKNIIEKYSDIFKPFILKLLKLNNIDASFTFKNVELKLERYKDYHKRVDFNLVINENIYVDIELNSERYKYVKLRNMTYFVNLLNSALSKGDKLKVLENKNYKQLNLNIKDKLYEKENYYFYNDYIKRCEFKEHIGIHNYNLAFYKKEYYNKNIKLKDEEKFLVAICSKTIIELYDILSEILSEKEVKEIVKEVIKFSMDEYVISEEALLAGAKIEDYMIQKYAEERGKKQGIKETTINLAKKFLNLGVSIKDVSKATGLSIEKLKSLN